MRLLMDVLTPGLTWADIEHERAVAASGERWVNGRTAEDRKRLWDAHATLIAQRSAAAVEAMERAGGLAHV
jgi:hypothetical protein